MATTLIGLVALAAVAVVGAQASFETVNVCQKVPGIAVAASVAGRPLDERPVNIKGFNAARCIYGIEIGGTRRAFVVWLEPVGEFDGLKAASDPPITAVTGVGDDAFAVTDADTKRLQLTARMKGKVTIQVTGDRLDWVQAVAKAALARF
jgi:hypothetical protein